MAASFPNSLKTWTPVVDNVTNAQASDINTLYDEVTAIETKLREGADGKILSISSGVPTWIDPATSLNVNIETLTGNKTLTENDALYQILNLNGTARDLILPTGTNKCKMFFISNATPPYQTGTLTVKYNSTTISVVEGYISQFAQFYWNGTTWLPGDGSSISFITGYGAKGRATAVVVGKNALSNCGYQDLGGVSIGEGANSTVAWDPGVSVGRGSNGAGNGSYAGGAACGTGANAYDYGASLGHYAVSTGSGTSLGYGTNSNSKNAAIAKGMYSKCERWNEEWKCSDVVATNKYGTSYLNWHGETTNDTATEIFLGGTSNQRAILIANSAYMFDINLIAYCNAGTKGKTIKIQGGIRRGGSNNTSLIGTPVITTISEDGTTNYNITITADDTNESLKLTVTGVAGETVRWNASGILSECRF
jgi:hypothetical protein